MCRSYLGSLGLMLVRRRYEMNDVYCQHISRLDLGRDYVLSFDLESREFNGRWYTDVNVYAARDFVQAQGAQGGYPAYGAESQGGYSQPQAGFQQSPAPQFGGVAAGPAPTFDSVPANADEDLPF